MKNVLVIDDDPKLAALLQEYLQERGFLVESVDSGKSGIQHLQHYPVDVIVLDVMMPGLDGFETLQEIRKFSSVPVLMLTARGDDMDRIVGLEMGADDYLAKPFNPRELLARIKAILRRIDFESAPQIETSPNIQVGDITLLMDRREVLYQDAVLPMTTMEFDILVILFSRAGRIVTRDALTEELKGGDWMIFDRSLDVHISHIRKKIGDDQKPYQIIKTIRGVGYLVSK